MNKSIKNVFTTVKSFPGATVNCMKDYLKPTLQKKPDIIIIHAGTNDLKIKPVEEIANNLIELASDSSENDNMVVISSVLPRNDNQGSKVKDINRILKQKCTEKNIGFLEHDNFKNRYHLNKSKIHPNQNGAAIIAGNFIEFLNNF